ncbi:MAG: hypothetical protein K8R40_03385 [Anaerolineaceae bacterium]|nr:hypothetical protein [Anaerolineaceae bacterium]
MSKPQQRTFFILIGINILLFLLFLIPNSVGVDDLDMVRIFEPDEGDPIRIVYQMLEQGDSFKSTLLNFLLYNYYHYGFPYFGFSALLLIPLKWLGLYPQAAVVFPLLRQMISVLPMLISLTFLTYLWTRFQSLWCSALLFLFLALTPAVVANNFWWHPDSLAFLFCVLTIFFLHEDDYQFGWKFYLSAVFCGFAIGTKFIGLFFFLTIPIYLYLGFRKKHLALSKTIVTAAAFAALMIFSIWLSNPMLVYSGVRDQYWRFISLQSISTAQGYDIQYPVGIGIFIEYVNSHYGGLILFFVALISTIWGIWTDHNRRLNLIILTFILPQIIYYGSSVALKYQYLLPLCIPLLSTVFNIYPFVIESSKNFTMLKRKKALKAVLIIACALLIAIPTVQNIQRGYEFYSNHIHKLDNNPNIRFYQEIKPEILDKLDTPVTVYIDYRVYLPSNESIYTFWSYNMLDVEYIQAHSPELVVLMQQRIEDYTSLENIEKAIDPVQMEKSSAFYSDADNENINGYVFLYRDSFGLVFMRQDYFETHYH